jgi:hypothetical protein
MKHWTDREPLLPEDRAVISDLVKLYPQSAGVFVAGEVREDHIGEEAALTLYKANDALPEPLFIQTRQKTVRMARFKPEEVWRCFHPDILVKLVAEESRRLGAPFVPLDVFDYYESFALLLRRDMKDRPCFPIAPKEHPDVCYHVMYLGALLLLGKPNYMGVPVAAHFALKEAEEFLATVDFRILNYFELKEFEEVRAAGRDAKALTNGEIAFLLKLHDNDIFRGQG